MGRLLFLILVGLAGFWLWRRLHKPRPATSTPHEPSGPTPMVRCAHCGTHVPRPEALTSEGQWFCSQRHLEQGPRQP